MHFPIIVFEDILTPKEEWLYRLPNEDSCLLANTDYCGDIYSADHRFDVIHSNWLRQVFDGIAVVDPVTESLYFKNQFTIRHTILEYYKKETERLHNLAEAGRFMYYDAVSFGKRFKDDYTLYFNRGYGYAQTSLDFIDDTPYYAEKTLRIGNIFDAHF